MDCSEFLSYIVSHERNGSGRLPPLSQISQETALGIGKLREQMAVARVLGLVEAAPRRGIQTLQYDFRPAARASLEAGMALDENCFLSFADLRISLEAFYWDRAVTALNADDLERLSQICNRAEDMLSSNPPEIPREEHRLFHLEIFCRLGNPFVRALLQTYWDVYQSVAPKYYEDMHHLQEIWSHHRNIVNSLLVGNVEAGRQENIRHMHLLEERRNRAGDALQAVEAART